MTELEMLLLNGLNELLRQGDRRQQIYRQEQSVLREMFARIETDNRLLREQLDILSRQIASLRKQLSQFNQS